MEDARQGSKEKYAGVNCEEGPTRLALRGTSSYRWKSVDTSVMALACGASLARFIEPQSWQ